MPNIGTQRIGTQKSVKKGKKDPFFDHFFSPSDRYPDNLEHTVRWFRPTPQIMCQKSGPKPIFEPKKSKNTFPILTLVQKRVGTPWGVPTPFCPFLTQKWPILTTFDPFWYNWIIYYIESRSNIKTVKNRKKPKKRGVKKWPKKVQKKWIFWPPKFHKPPKIPIFTTFWTILDHSRINTQYLDHMLHRITFKYKNR